MSYRTFQHILGCFLAILMFPGSASCRECVIPGVLRGSWFVFEQDVIDIDHESMTNRGRCIEMQKNNHEDIKLLFLGEEKQNGNICFHCVQFYVRNVNLLEMKQTSCQTYSRGYKPSITEACSALSFDQSLFSMFNENFVAKNCRSVLEGVWHFAYQNRFSFTGECSHPEALIKSCQEPGTQFLIANQKFTIDYKKCEGIKESYEGTTEYSCLGDWLDGKNHYFAVANTKESRKEEKYRCFIRNRDDDIYMGHSITPECSKLKSVENSPARLRMTPVKHDVVQPGCFLPQNFTGRWINTAHFEADIHINQTHITEVYHPNIGRTRETIYVCKERRDNRYMMARLNIDGCQTDFVCFDFVPRHHNIIRFRKGLEMIREDFATVCGYIQFKSGKDWRYDIMLAHDPVPQTCPLAGMFTFEQTGDEPLTTRLLGGPTAEPWDGIICRQNISEFKVCGGEQKEIAIDVEACITVDAYGREVDIYTLPDYKLRCIGFWKENMKSYMITYDERDPVSRYRCWVYQRADLNKIILSQSVGPSCNLQQTVAAKKITEGAAVSLFLTEFEREHDRCPMRFDDGSNPWRDDRNKIHVFDFKKGGVKGGAPSKSSLGAATVLLMGIAVVLRF